jgi:hypothetical protein
MHYLLAQMLMENDGIYNIENEFHTKLAIGKGLKAVCSHFVAV